MDDEMRRLSAELDRLVASGKEWDDPEVITVQDRICDKIADFADTDDN